MPAEVQERLAGDVLDEECAHDALDERVADQRPGRLEAVANGHLDALRLGHELPDDARLSGEPISEAIGLQTNNPGWPGFSSVGSVLAMGLYVSVGL